jgi:O-methyltransferase involved in polyketide biosynthesis
MSDSLQDRKVSKNLAEVVDSTLTFIRLNSTLGSSICFDYASLSPQNLNNSGVKKLRERMKSQYQAEPTRFGIAEGKLASFLSERGYDIIEHLTANDWGEETTISYVVMLSCCQVLSML